MAGYQKKPTNFDHLLRYPAYLAGSFARGKFWYRSYEAVWRMGRKRFEILSRLRRSFRENDNSHAQNNSASCAG